MMSNIREIFLTDKLDINFDQKHLLSNLVSYLIDTSPSIKINKIGDKIEVDQKVQLDPDQEYTKKIIYKLHKFAEDGSCFGFTFFVLYSVWLQMHSLPTEKEIDNWTWFKKTFITLSKWDKDITKLSENDKKDFNRLINYIIFFQDPTEWIGVGQSNIEKAFEDTVGNIMQKINIIAGLFTREELNEISLSIPGDDQEKNSDLKNKKTEQQQMNHVFSVEKFISSRTEDISNTGDTQEDKKDKIQNLSLNLNLTNQKQFMSLIAGKKQLDTDQKQNSYSILKLINQNEGIVMISAYKPFNRNEKNRIFFHETGMIKYGDKYYFYDPNYKTWLREYTEETLQEMIKDIFYANNAVTGPLILLMREYDITKKDNQDKQGEKLHKIDSFLLENLLRETNFIKKNISFKIFSKDSMQLVHLLAMRGDNVALRFYLEEGRDFIEAINDKTNDQYKLTPLEEAIIHQHPEIIRILIEYGANLELGRNDGKSILHWAVENKYIDIVRLLIEGKRINIDVQDNEGNTPLITAVREGNEEIVDLLIKNDADIFIHNLRDESAFNCLGEISEDAKMERIGIMLIAKMETKDTQELTSVSKEENYSLKTLGLYGEPNRNDKNFKPVEISHLSPDFIHKKK